MPAIQGVYTIDPRDGATEGIYVSLSGVGVVGLPRSQWPSLGGSPATRLQRTQDAINAEIAKRCEVRTPTSQVDPALVTSPEPHCYVDGSFYVARLVIVDVPVLSVDPIVLGPITVSNGASREVRA